VDESGEGLIDYGSAAQFVEPTVSGRNIGIKIRNITKVFICDYSHNVY